jgi:tetratricopeptide (TPR) repeat protein
LSGIYNTIDSYDKTTKLINLGYQILKFRSNGNIDSVISDILESINKIDEGEDAILKCYAYSDFSGLLFKSGKIKESDEILNKAICLFSLINVFDRLEAIRCVGREIVLECKFDLLGVINRHVLEIAHQLNDDWFDYLGTSEEGMIESVLYELRLKGDFELIEKIIQEQYYLNQLTSLNKFIYKWHSLSGELDKLNSIFINSVRCYKIPEKEQNFQLYKIALIFISIGDLEKPLSIINYLSDTSQKTSLYTKIGIEYFKRGNDNLVDDLATRININDERFDYYRSIILYFISNNVDTKKIKKYISKLDQLIINKFNNDDFKKLIISLYIEIGELFIALEYSKKIWDLDEQYLTQIHISIEFAKLGKIDEALTCVNNLTDGYWKFSAMRGISAELAIQGKKQNSEDFLKEAFEYALKSSDFYKISALEEVAIELAKKGKVEEAFQIVEQIIDESRKKRSLESISIELAVQGKLENAYDIAIGIFDENYVPYGAFRKISIEFLKLNKLDTVLEFIKVKNNENLKNNIYSEISCEFAKLDKIDMAIENANLITSEYIKCDALQSISAELVKKENLKVAEYVTKYITQSKKRYECLELIGKNLFQTNGILSALNNIKEFSSIESENIIKCAIVNSINVTNINTEIAVQGCKDSHQEISSLEHLLQMQALNLLFFPSLSEEKIQRFNRTLNIQWAIDIKNSFSEN